MGPTGRQPRRPNCAQSSSTFHFRPRRRSEGRARVAWHRADCSRPATSKLVAGRTSGVGGFGRPLARHRLALFSPPAASTTMARPLRPKLMPYLGPTLPAQMMRRPPHKTGTFASKRRLFSASIGPAAGQRAGRRSKTATRKCGVAFPGARLRLRRPTNLHLQPAVERLKIAPLKQRRRPLHEPDWYRLSAASAPASGRLLVSIVTQSKRSVPA